MPEQPRAPRFRIDSFNVVYDTGDGFWSAPVVDVSESGLFVETTHELPLGTQVTILPEIPEGAGLPFEIHAEVVRVNQYDLDNHFDRTPGIAFRWTSMSADQIATVRDFLARFGAPVR